jgi:signal transduction histidine kinase
LYQRQGEFRENLPGTEAGSVLIVDDEAIIRSLCSKAFPGWRILQAENGEQALALLAGQDVDLVLTDVMMPTMNGLDLLRAIKERQPHQAVIIMTGLGDREVVLKALQADADDFVSKPLHPLQLQTTVATVLQKKKLKEELVHLKHMDRLKSEFLGLVSHKLNTPITTISLFIQNLSRGISDPADPEFKQTLTLIQHESEYLGHLVQDLLQFSEFILQEGPPALEVLDLGELARTILLKKYGMAVAKGIRVTEALPSFPPLPLDHRRLTFAIQALLDNAIKFTPCGGEIGLQGVVNDFKVQLIITDNGQGIPAGELGKVFEKFYQVDPGKTGQVRGFGLGLFYARQFVQEHGGQLHLQSAVQTGTRAIITLPRPGAPTS